MILAIDTSSAACSAALIGADGRVIAAADERIGRGHAERLAPMIEEMLGGRVPSSILVGVGPGSFTGIRVGIAAAQGLAIGWDVPLSGIDSLALTAATALAGLEAKPTEIGIAQSGGHGELFVRAFHAEPLSPVGDLANLTPGDAAAVISAELVAGSGAQALVEARGSGIALDTLPSARFTLSLPEAMRCLSPKPSYGRAPDAKPLIAA